MSKKNIAIVLFILFLILNTIKIAFFDSLLIFQSTTLSLSLFNSGIIVKFLAVSLVFILISRLNRPFLFIFAYCFQLLYMFANLSYHIASEGYLHITQYFGLFSETMELVKHSAVPANNSSGFLFIDTLLFIAVVFLYKDINFINKKFVFKKALVVFTCTLVFFAYKWQSVEAKERPAAILNDRYSCDNNVVHKYGLLAFNIVDILNLKDANNRIKRINYGREINGIASDSAKPCIVMIQVESMDSYIVKTKHHNEWVTPFLHSLTKKCIYYPYVLSFHKAGSTSDCEFSVINGIEPFDDYPAMKLRDYNYPNSLVKPLKAAGYEAVAFHGNRGTYFNRNIALKKMGFNMFYDMQAMNLPEQGWGASDGDVFDFTMDKLKSLQKPFFCYIITMSSHEPFTLVNSYYTNNRYNDIKDNATANYFRAFSYVDGQLERFVNHVKKEYKNSYIFIYGDHTPPIENGDGYKRASFTANNELYEFVPLFLLTPMGTIYEEKSSAAMFTDFAATVLPSSQIDFKIHSPGRDLTAFPHDSNRLSYLDEKFSRNELFKLIRQ